MYVTTSTTCASTVVTYVLPMYVILRVLPMYVILRVLSMYVILCGVQNCHQAARSLNAPIGECVCQQNIVSEILRRLSSNVREALTLNVRCEMYVAAPWYV